MKVNSIKLLFLLFLGCSCFGISSCGNQTTGVVQVKGDQVVEEEEDPFIQGNKRILALELEEIDLVIRRHRWDMQTTGTGLCYQLLKQGTGRCFVEGDSVALKYSIRLLSGETVYDSETDGVKTFRVDKSEEIPALHEAAKLLSPGAEARLVIPSHLAYGAGGDGNKIKGREAIIMNLEVLNIN